MSAPLGSSHLRPAPPAPPLAPPPQPARTALSCGSRHIHWPRPIPAGPAPFCLPAPPCPVGPSPSCRIWPTQLTVQPSRAVWYSAASVASLSSSRYRGQLRVGNLSSWRRLRLRGDKSVSGARLQAGKWGWGGPVSGPRFLPDMAEQSGMGGSPHQDNSAPGKASLLRFREAPSPQPRRVPAWSLSRRPSPSLPPPGPVQPLTLSSVTGTVCTGMGLQAASERPGAASGNSPARLA